MDLGYLAAEWAAVGARRSGRDRYFLSTYAAPPMASAAALLVGSGFIVPMVGRSAPWRDCGQYRRLRPLWKAGRRAGARGRGGPGRSRPGFRSDGPAPYRLGGQPLGPLAREFRRSPVVAAARRAAATATPT
ncbi:hypothetical protein ACFWBC_06085 [Streptomyces sp. NPDC059985]|uniref:hypothetical protein n=1 Tax=Streptomyces sp. NPDC059985 TaxID=3347025 RepID=UPI0036B38AC6